MSHKHALSRRIAFILALSALAAMAGLLPAGLAWSEEEYVIGVDDLLQIQVWDNKDLDQVVPVRPDGKISFPLVGERRASGLTVSQLTDLLVERLGKSVKSPNVSVMVKEIRSFRVFFVGQVMKSGVYPIKAGTPLLQALTLAGGTAPAADLSSAYIVRGSERIPVDLRRLIQKGDLAHNLPLRTDDTVVVPEIVAGANPLSVFIMGEIAKPGAYPLGTEPLTLMKLVSLAGGLTKFAAPARITVIRENGVDGGTGQPKANHKVRLKVNLDAIQKNPQDNPDLFLEPGDVVVVPQTLF